MGARAWAVVFALAAAMGGCSGGGSVGATACVGDCATPQNFLTADDVRRVIAQAAGEAQARGNPATIAVVDRVGNVLAVFAMTGAPATVATNAGYGVTGGLDGIGTGVVPASLVAITKALTGAYLSSEGNAFSTRTASQIVQEHFNPTESQQPSGPLFGVQFSQLSCSDVNRNLAHGSVGPKRSPLGLAADPGGIPLYKNGTLVGGIGVEANALYTLDRDVTNIDADIEESIAMAGGTGFDAPDDRRGERITADGRTFRYLDAPSLVSNPANAPSFTALSGSLVAVPGFVGASVGTGTAFGTAASGIRADSGVLGALGAYVLVDAANANRYPPQDATEGGLVANDVRAILGEALKVANRARAQIRRPLGSPAEVTISVVDYRGIIVGLVGTRDAPVFGIDVAVQKARGALLLSHPQAAALFAAAPPAQYVTPGNASSSIAAYATAMGTFAGEAGALNGAVAFSTRAIGNLHRPMYPDGIDGTPNGPLSKPIGAWSPFSVGLQLDLVYNQFVKALGGDLETGCSGRSASSSAPGIALAANGIQIFPGGVPIYRGAQLIGAIGISGDGVDQDDMIAFLGLANAATLLGNGVGHAPPARRADAFSPQGLRLRYVQCPQSPFNGSSEQNVCAGL
ncbi:heme-binding protein [Usitatibacter palustris]|uniref:Heme-binding protein n=1 Tax=Usitatibacter palustris TaxID=2732487 RepID=A0A6M4H833_9PROT|nr:heme-binding protein [Usitatibacter palustris]QJR15018.1 hypothetical protein DSM104440_01834 [Usitatibacter palustris]